MGVRFGSQFSNVPLNPLPASATPTFIYQVVGLVMPTDNAIVALAWFVNMTGGTGLTSLTVALYRNVMGAGPLLGAGPWTVGSGPGNTVQLNGNYVDLPGPGTQAYSLSIAQTGAIAAGTLNDGCLLAFVL